MLKQGGILNQPSTNPAKLPSQLSYTWPGRTGETAFTPDLFLHSADEC